MEGGVVFEFGFVGAGEFEDVFGGFFFDDVDDVVDGDAPDEDAVGIENGEGAEVVFGGGAGDFFLVGVGLYGDGVFDGEGGEGLLEVGGFEQFPELDVSLEAAVGGDDVGEVYGFFEVDGSDVGDGLGGGHVGGDGDKVGGHDAAGGFFVVFE